MCEVFRIIRCKFSVPWEPRFHCNISVHFSSRLTNEIEAEVVSFQRREGQEEDVKHKLIRYNRN